MREDLIQFRRGTMAQWATADAAGRHLAAGEPGFNTDAPRTLRIGDGTTAFANLPTAAAAQLDASGNFVWDGAILSNHNAKYFHPADMEGTAQYVTSAATLAAPPYWSFDQTTIERVKWTWVPGDAWTEYTVRLGFFNATVAAANEVVWRYYERRTVVNAGDPTGNWTTAPTQIAQITQNSGTLAENRYVDLAVDVPVTPLTTVLSVIERIADDAADDLAGDAGLYIVTATHFPPLTE